MPILLIVDEPLAGAWNMAVDEALLMTAAERGEPTLRVYGWSEPTLSLGYFQRFEDRGAHVGSARCAIVRRSTGGGAILHDREITYSFCRPIADRVAASLRSLYDQFHGALIDVVRETTGAEARLHGESPTNTSIESEPFLCFQRRAEADVILRGSKVLGSAQRRKHSALLQHGSILWQRSPFAPELPGLIDLAPNLPTQTEFVDLWLRRVERRLGESLVQGKLSEHENNLAQKLHAEVFTSGQWLGRR